MANSSTGVVATGGELAKALVRLAEHRDPELLVNVARAHGPALQRLKGQYEPAETLADWERQALFALVLDAADRFVADEARTDYHALIALDAFNVTAERLAPALPMFVPLADYAGSTPPLAIIWRDEPGINELKPAVPVLSETTVSLLSGMGGGGKTTLVLSLAITAARGGGATCGLCTRPGPVVILCYEDSPETLHARARQIIGGPVPADVLIWPSPSPLWVTADLRSGTAEPGPDWARLWENVGRINPTFVVFDPLTAAAAFNQNEAALARAFMAAVADEARNSGSAVLIVGHDTKSTRSNPLDSDPAGAVAGSGTFHDAARGVLHFRRPVGKKDPLTPRQRALACVKSNFGPSRWEIILEERYRGHLFVGFDVVEGQPVEEGA